MVRAVGEQTFQPKIGFKTRYGMIDNPFAVDAGALADGNDAGSSNTAFTKETNQYYRRVKVANLM